MKRVRMRTILISPAQGPVPPPGGGDGNPPPEDDEDKEDEDDESSDSKMREAEVEQPEDPDNVPTGKFYKPQTPHGKAMVKIFRHFCNREMQLPSWCTLASIALRASVLSTKTTGMTLFPSGRNVIQIKTVLSE